MRPAPVFWKGLMRGSFQSWGPVQFKQYYSLLGRLKHVGVEIEERLTLQSNTSATAFWENAVTKLENKVGEFPEHLLGKPVANKGGYLVPACGTTSGELEFHVLHCVSNPIQLYKQLSWIDEATALGLNLNGSLHLNCVGAYRSGRNFGVDSDFYSFPYHKKGDRRLQVRRGQASQSKAEIVRQMVLFGCLTHWKLSADDIEKIDDCMLDAMRPEDRAFALNHRGFKDSLI